MLSEQKLVRFDWAMKHMLRNKANYDIIEGFLCALLENNNLKVIEIIESESNKDYANDKFNRVDILVKDNEDRNIIIEIQNTRESDYLYRMLYGVSKNIVQSIDSGDKYRLINKVISVSILYFDLGIGTDYLYTGEFELVGKTTNERINKNSPQVQKLIPKGARYNQIEIQPEYYLIQIGKYQNIIKKAIDEWIYWFKNEKIKEGSHSKNIQKVEEKLKILKMSSKERASYERYLERYASELDMLETAREDAIQEGREKGIQEGREKGIQEGREKGIQEGELRVQIKTSIEAFKENISNELIRKLTNLSEEIINKIRQFWQINPDITVDEIIEKLKE